LCYGFPYILKQEYFKQVIHIRKNTAW
jgi:hypothetical protein